MLCEQQQASRYFLIESQAVSQDMKVVMNKRFSGDNRFNGLRFSATLGCLIDDNGEKVRMRHRSTQVFLQLRQNMNKLVTKEHLMYEVSTDDGIPTDDIVDRPATGLGNESVTGQGYELGSEGSLNECIDEIRHVVSDDRLKTIPHVGYLLTPDTTTDESVKLSNTHATTLSDHGRRLVPAIFQELMFNSQWVISGYQRSPRTWIGIFVLTSVALLSSVSTSASTTPGHIAYDRTDVNACVNRFAVCASCIPHFWQTPSSLAYSNWFLSSGCNPR